MFRLNLPRQEGVAATSTRVLVRGDREEVINSKFTKPVGSGTRTLPRGDGRRANEVAQVRLLLAQCSPHWGEAICADDLNATVEGWVGTATGASMLNGLDRRAPILAITRDVTGLVTQQTFALIFLDTWLAAILGSVPLAIAVNALSISAVMRRWPGGSTGRPRREATHTFWPSSGRVQDLQQERVAQTSS